MRRVVTIAVIGLALVLSGCGWEGEGTVTEKTHNDGYWYTTTICTPSGKTTVCTPMTQYMPEQWGYKVQDSKGDIHDVTTSQEDWETHNIGDHFNNKEAGNK